MKKAIASVVSFIAGVFIAAHVQGCAALESKEAKQAEAELSLGAQYEKCTKDSATKAESKACEARVDARMRVDGGAR